MSVLHVNSNFPGGAVDNVSINDNTICFEAPLDFSPRSLWFYFSVDGCAGKKITLIQQKLERVLGYNESRGYQPVVPVWKDGINGTWERVDEQSIVYSEHPYTFRFEVSPVNDICFVAFCYPYLFSDWAAFLETLPKEYITRKQIGTTKAGRPFYRYIIKSPHSDPKRYISVTARQHAGEVSGSYVMEGLVRRLTDGSSEMESLLEKSFFCVVPFMDSDCVEEGKYGKDQSPVDYNRDWRWRPYQPEITAMQAELERLGQDSDLLWAFDLHAPQPGGASYMPPVRSCLPGTVLWNRMWNFGIAYEDACKGKVSFHLKDVDTEVLNWGGMNNRALTENYFSARWHRNMTCFEYSYHRDGEGNVLHIQDWHKFGEILAETIGAKLFDSALDPEPDSERIPEWAVPTVLTGWTSAQRIDGIRIEEKGSSISLIPSEDRNHCWLTSSLDSRQADHWEISAEADTTITVYASYYRDGLLVDHARKEYIYLTAGQNCRWTPPESPEAECFTTMSIICKDLKGCLTVTAG